jgi:HK97 family phage portal protein
MGFVFSRERRPRDERYWGISQPSDLVPRRVGTGRGVPYVDPDSARRVSAVWAAVRLRADLISTMPLHAFRKVADGMQVETNLSPFMANSKFMEWRYSSQIELDSTGNSIGVIRAVDGMGLAADIELAPTTACSLIYRSGVLAKYRIHGEEYDPSVVWHEKQYTVAGLDVGLSPVAYAALTLGQYKTVQDFATQWFLSGNGPRANLKNTEKKLIAKEAAVVKEAWRASQVMGEPFVHGSDWEYSLVEAQQASTDWIEAQRLSNVDVARFFGVPADLLDAAVAGGPNVTYANVSQRNLQFMIMHLTPAIVRRENALSQLLPRPRYVELDADATLLRMDPATRATVTKTLIDARVLAPSEARAMDNREPYTDAQIQEFELLGLNKTATGALTGAEGIPTPAGTQEEPLPPEAAGQGNQGN